MRLLDGHMNQIINKLEAHESKTPSRWREAAEYRQANKSWLRHSQRIAMLMLDQVLGSKGTPARNAYEQKINYLLKDKRDTH